MEITTPLSADNRNREWVRELDPDLFNSPACHTLTELGLEFCADTTKRFGTPHQLVWTSGSYEFRVCTIYHSGGDDGHTSVGPLGAGAPRNGLIIAQQVNQAAGREVYTPLMRAIVFCALAGHDYCQLCGRSLLPYESGGPQSGDEYASAMHVKTRYLTVGYNKYIANQLYKNVLSTAYNPIEHSQNVDYGAWYTSADPIWDILQQELAAAADLFGVISRRGALNAIEHVIESMCLVRNDCILQERLMVRGIDPHKITTVPALLKIIGTDRVLRKVFIALFAEQPIFLDTLVYSDRAIKVACGYRIDELFPGKREESKGLLDKIAHSLRCGNSPLNAWLIARRYAGYPA